MAYKRGAYNTYNQTKKGSKQVTFLFRLPNILSDTQSYARFSVPSREVSGVARQLGVVRVVCGIFVHFLHKSVLLFSASETS